MGLKKELRFLVLLTLIFSIINNYVTIFINLYIWEGSHHISQVAWFNVAMLFFWGIAFLIGGKVFTRYSLRVTIRISSSAAILTFILLLSLHVSSILWTLIIGGSTGIMCGFYFISQNLFVSLYGHGEDFKTYFAVTNIAQQILSIVNPVLFAFIIKWFGYSASFVTMCVIVCILFTLSFFIPNPVISPHDREKPFFYMEKPFQSIKFFKTFLTSCIIMGSVVQFQVLLIQLFTFAITDNKLIIAGLNVLYTLLTIFAFRFVQKTQGSQIRFLRFGGTLMVISYLLSLYSTPFIFIIVCIFSSLGYFLVMTNWNANQFLYLSDYKSIRLTKLIVGRELMIILGRVIMLCVIAQVEEFRGRNFIVLIVTTIVCVGLLLFIEKKPGKSQGDKTNSVLLPHRKA